MHVKRNEEVVVVSGEHKGKTGKVLKVFTKQKRVIVEGVNLVKRHQKAVQGKQGGIVEKEAPIQVSNVAIFNPATNKADRVGYKVEEGTKVRIFKSTGEAIDS